MIHSGFFKHQIAWALFIYNCLVLFKCLHNENETESSMLYTTI